MISRKEDHIEKTKKNIAEYIEGTYHTVRELIFVKIRFREFREFWSILRKLVPSKIIGNIRHIGKTSHFSHTPPHPPPDTLTLIHFGHIDKIFHFFSHLLSHPVPISVSLIHFGHIGNFFHSSFTLSPLPRSVTDPLRIYWQNISFFPYLFPRPVTLIHFGYIGEIFNFSLSPSPLPSFETLIHFAYIGKTFHFPLTTSPPVPCSVTLLHF